MDAVQHAAMAAKAASRCQNQCFGEYRNLAGWYNCPIL